MELGFDAKIQPSFGFSGSNATSSLSLPSGSRRHIKVKANTHILRMTTKQVERLVVFQHQNLKFGFQIIVLDLISFFQVIKPFGTYFI